MFWKAISKTKVVGEKVADTALDVAGKAKNTAQQTWESVKETTQKMKDTVKGKAEESTEAIKNNVNIGMNTKNWISNPKNRDIYLFNLKD